MTDDVKQRVLRGLVRDILTDHAADFTDVLTEMIYLGCERVGAIIRGEESGDHNLLLNEVTILAEATAKLDRLHAAAKAKEVS